MILLLMVASPTYTKVQTCINYLYVHWLAPYKLNLIHWYFYEALTLLQCTLQGVARKLEIQPHVNK